jgi:hypothetical protein
MTTDACWRYWLFSAPDMQLGRVFLDNISWPIRGPNVELTIGSTMRSGGRLNAKTPCKYGCSDPLVAPWHPAHGLTAETALI